MGIIHRDLKPENLVLDFKGFLKLTDFGISRYMRKDNASDSSGTAGYIAPEVLYHQNHGPPADFFALGVICYEMLLGARPYPARSRKELREQIAARQVYVKAKDLTFSTMSEDGIDFINRLLQRKPKNRLGFEDGIISIKSHQWFSDFPWGALQDKSIRPPYRPRYIETDINFGEQTDPDQNVIVDHVNPYPTGELGRFALTPDPFLDFPYQPRLLESPTAKSFQPNYRKDSHRLPELSGTLIAIR